MPGEIQTGPAIDHWIESQPARAEAGIRTLFTANDTTNADMLALNEHLGYRPTHVQLELTKDL